MKTEQLKELGLTEEQVKSVFALAKSEMEEIRNELAEVKTGLETAQNEIKTRDGQIAELNKADPTKLEETIKTLQAQNKQAQQEYAEKLKSERMQNAIDKALLQHGAKNAKAVNALLDKEKLEITEDGTIKGLEEQFKTLVEGKDTAFLFESNFSSNSNLKGGFAPGSSGDTPPSTNPFATATFNMEEQGRLFKENPAEARRLAGEANYKI